MIDEHRDVSRLVGPGHLGWIIVAALGLIVLGLIVPGHARRSEVNVIDEHRDVTRLVGRGNLGWIIVAALGLFVVLPCALAPERRYRRCSLTTEEAQKVDVLRLVREGFLAWALENMDSGCPATLMEVAVEVDLGNTKDR